ncbi:hypothetical protein NW768_011570 [Fusarium equiseti]|uniref:Uncharacterized protein n=1 Tax=Fusarium equiseti TaxID=61235 RepID=A0ABQ8QY02_FUSEQ|nr:hypothetical protein NW768_011570 [Fusarium equiseti]
MSFTNTTEEEKTMCINWAVLKRYLQDKKVSFHPTVLLSNLTKPTIVPGSPDSLGRKFVDGNQEFQKAIREDYISKWLSTTIVHYERNQESCFFINTNDDLPVGQVDSRKDPSEILWTVAARSASRDAFRILPGNVFEVLKNNIKAFQDDKDTEDAILSETSADSMSDGEGIVTVTRAVTRAECLKTAGTLWVGLQSINTDYAPLNSLFGEWVGFWA